MGNAGFATAMQRSIERIAAKAPVYAKDIRDNPHWLLMFAFGRFSALRRLHARVIGGSRPVVPLPDRPSSVSATISTEQIVARINRDGICGDLTLDPARVAEIQAFAASNLCFGSFDHKKPFLVADHQQAEQNYRCNILVGHFLESVSRCPACMSINQDRQVWAIAQAYFGFTPKLVSSRLWWSFRSQGATDADLSVAAQSYHYDLDDWNQLKIFFYLSDVTVSDGPHSFIAGSHRRKPLRFQMSPFVGRPEREIIAEYGPASLVTMTGPAGSGFAEDSFGYHVGVPILAGPRLIYEVSFGSTGVMKRRPFGTL